MESTKESKQVDMYFNENTYKSFENHKYTLLSDRLNLFRFFKLGKYDEEATPDNMPESYVTKNFTTTTGRVINVRPTIPKEIINPPKYSEDMYPLNDNGIGFKDEKPYDYLVNFTVESLFNSEDSIKKKLILRLLESQAQSRFSTIWRELCAVVNAVDIYHGDTNHALRWYIQKLYCQGDDFDFYERQGKIMFNWKQGKYGKELVNKSLSSTLPLLVYTVASVGCDYLFGHFTHVEMIIAMNHYLKAAVECFQDTKLKIKGSFRDWLPVGLNKLGKTKVPLWNAQVEVVGNRVRSTREHHEAIKVFEESMIKFKENVTDELYGYFQGEFNRCKSCEDYINLALTLRCISNDRTFYGTLPELATAKAVLPKLQGNPVPGPTVTIRDANTKEVYKLDFNHGDNCFIDHVFTTMKRVVPLVSKHLKDKDFDILLSEFMTTSSSGTRLSEMEKLRLTPQMQAMAKTRIIRFGIDIADYKNLEFYIEMLGMPTKMGIRIQIDRRMRSIAMVPNQRLTLGYISHAFSKVKYKYGNSASGKQTGHSYDLKNLLIATSQKDTWCTSNDVVGMDNHIQAALASLTDAQDFLIAEYIKSSFAAFATSKVNVEVFDSGNWTTIDMEITGLQKALGFMYSHKNTATALDTEFGTIVNRQGTFESGLPNTTGHHTNLLDAISHTHQVLQTMDNKPIIVTGEEFAGDDSSKRYHHYDPDVIYDDNKREIQRLTDMGFKMTEMFSTNVAVFLQMCCVDGRYYGFPDRVSLLTREDRKEVYKLEESVKEMTALVNDLMSRVRNQRGLKLLAFMIANFCLSRFTFSMKNVVYDSFCSTMKSKGIRIQEYVPNKTRPTRLVTIYVPSAWFHMHGGGEMPSYPYQRRDGTWTCDASLYSPTGDYARRLLFDISNIKNMITLNKLYLDHEILDKYGFEAGQFLINIGILKLEKTIVERLVNKGEISKLAKGIKNQIPNRKIKASEMAYTRLLSKGYVLKDSLVYAFHLEHKMQAVSETVSLESYEVSDLSKMVYNNAKRFSQFKNNLRLQKNDVLHCHYFEESDKYLPYLEFASHITDIRIANAYEPFNESWHLFATLGAVSAASAEVRAAINSIKGKSYSFRTDDPIYKEGFKLYKNKSRRGLLNDFFIATGVSPKERSLYVLAYRNQIRYGGITYDYSVAPRQLFFISDNPLDAARLINNKLTYGKLETSGYFGALKCVYMYLWALQNSGNLRCFKYDLHLHPLITSKLVTKLFQK